MAGMKTIKDLTRPVVPREGVRPPVGIKKVIADRMPVDPYSPITGEKTFWRKDPIEMLQAAPGKALEGIRSLLGAKEAGDGEALDELISKRAMLISQINGEMMYGDDETLKNLMNEYKRLDNMIRTIQLQTVTGE